MTRWHSMHAGDALRILLDAKLQLHTFIILAVTRVDVPQLDLACWPCFTEAVRRVAEQPCKVFV